MIEKYTQHSANERTFLAWIRTGIAIVGFGFVIEKFNIFIATAAATTSTEIAKMIKTDHLTGPVGRYEGVAFMFVGIALIVLGFFRFLTTVRLINKSLPQPPLGVATEIAITAGIVLLVGMYSLSIVLS